MSGSNCSEEVRQDCILSPCLFNLYAKYIMRNAGLHEAQTRLKIQRRNINNPKCTDDRTLMAESGEELKTLDESESVSHSVVSYSLQLHGL